jgi:hypothetical protein
MILWIATVASVEASSSIIQTQNRYNLIQYTLISLFAHTIRNYIRALIRLLLVWFS